MAPREWEPMSDGDPWRVSAFISAIVELFLSILLLLGAAIAFITSRLVKFFGIEPPCTYIGCAHTLHSESFRSQISSATGSLMSSHVSSDELCHPSRIYSKLECSSTSNNDDDDDDDDHSMDGLVSEHHDDRAEVSLSASSDPNNARNVVHAALLEGESANKMDSSVSPSDGGQNDEDASAEENQEEGMEVLKEALEAERMMLASLEAELENERNAAAVATSEAMSMISRLQEEKSSMQMEVAQLQRISEEKAEYDEQAMALLKEILFKRERENLVLEKEVELYRERLFVEKAIQLKRSWSSREHGSPSPQLMVVKPLLLHGKEAEDVMSSTSGATIQQALAEELDRQENGPIMETEDAQGSFVYHKASKIARDSPYCDVSGKIWDNAGGHGDTSLCSFHGEHSSKDQQLKRMGRSVFSTDDEETQSILDRLWVIEEELQELRGKEGPRNDRAGEEEFEGDGGAGPIHDVYEVQSTIACKPPCTEDQITSKGMEVMGKPSPWDPSDGSKGSKEVPHSLATGWMVGEPAHPDESHDLYHLQHIVARQEKHAEMEEIRGLAIRLKALEEDRVLLREMLESFKHRDAELNLLQEIAEHLRELRVAGFKVLSGGPLEETTSVTSPGRARSLKKRRFCHGPGQTSMLLLQQKSI